MRQNTMTLIGYARVSSASQDLDIQIGKLTDAGCEVIRSETVSALRAMGEAS